jgi:hypothetical protein
MCRGVLEFRRKKKPVKSINVYKGKETAKSKEGVKQVALASWLIAIVLQAHAQLLIVAHR